MEFSFSSKVRTLLHAFLFCRFFIDRRSGHGLRADCHEAPARPVGGGPVDRRGQTLRQDDRRLPGRIAMRLRGSHEAPARPVGGGSPVSESAIQP